MNPFTSESRDHILSTNLPEVCTRLRVPASLRALFSEFKPAHLSIGDTILKDRLDAILCAAIYRGDYRLVQRTLAHLFGPIDHEAEAMTTVVSPGNGRSR